MDAHRLLQQSPEYIKGVGTARATLLARELNLHTWEDVLHHFPFRYIDRRKFQNISEIHEQLGMVQLCGWLRDVVHSGTGRGQRLTAWLTDGTGEVALVWFQGIDRLFGLLKLGQEYVVFGRPVAFRNELSLPHPEITTRDRFVEQGAGQTLYPVYPGTEKLRKNRLESRFFSQITRFILDKTHGEVLDYLPSDIRKHHQLVDRQAALWGIHHPQSEREAQVARHRLKFDELFYLQFGLLHNKIKRQSGSRGHRFVHVGEMVNRFYSEQLPFKLTDAQKRVIREIRADMGTGGRQMNRLLQGDVGSGKTIVALMAMLLALDNGFQSCLMAPTEVLAVQHFQSLCELLHNMPVRLALLTGNVRTKERKVLLNDLQIGKIHILVGTHALIEPPVVFCQLGLAIIDEQHRFGVAQRAALWAKNVPPPHILVMTATPIPRTLAMTQYGDLDLSVIDELPAGRRPIMTRHVTDRQRLSVFNFLRKQIAMGRQIYIVYPMIEEGDDEQMKYLMDGYESVSRAFPIPDYQVSILHGRMRPDDKQMEMQRFVSGQTHIMVATTVIEVGVNVPNASVMLIENAERFGLSQLHQLRGRVGRGADQSYCLLMTANEPRGESIRRIEALCSTTDGFKIAEIDLQLRGPGDLSGTQQSGMLDLLLADLRTDETLIAETRQAVEHLLARYTDYSQPPLRGLLMGYQAQKSRHKNWGEIS
ncbi:MAG: ATP-dependent DNA helicase RecG [Sphingomonadales bacterium]|nr:ATP-dependent DNA helicase RecG [Sphingomonadales bacterium]